MSRPNCTEWSGVKEKDGKEKPQVACCMLGYVLR